MEGLDKTLVKSEEIRPRIYFLPALESICYVEAESCNRTA